MVDPKKDHVQNSTMGSRDLPSKRLLGTGLASVGYETELDGKKCARKDFMGVPSGTFRREASRLVNLEDHVNVVQTLGWIENKMSCSLVLEYMDDDLLGFLQKRKQSQGSLEAGPGSGNQSNLDSRNTFKLGSVELREALDVMLQIARGMEHLAEKGIRHGNLKTKNILVTRTNDEDGNSLSVKVTDFGLVRTRRKSSSFASRQARKLDMARWTAPEILQVFLLEDKGETSSESDSDEECTNSSDVADADVPEWRELGTDVYSFAVTCSQILTGEDPYPYPNLNWKELGVNIVRQRITPTLPAACPPELRELLESCWGFYRFGLLLPRRPSFSRIRSTLERLQRIDLALAQHLHQSLPLPEKAPMDIKREGQLRKPTLGKEPMDVVQEIDLLEPITVEDLGGPQWQRKPMPGKEPTVVVREIDLREPITVEDLWDPRDPITVEDIWDPRDPQYLNYLIPVSDIARLISRTRAVVRRRAEWTQLREELELMLPDMLRFRNRMVGCERILLHLGVDEYISFRVNRLGLRGPFDWFHRLRSVILGTLDEVGKYQQQEDDRSRLSSLSAALLEPGRVSKLRKDWNQLAKQRTEILLHLTKVLRQAQVKAKGKAKEQAKEETGVSTSAFKPAKFSKTHFRVQK